MTQAAKQADPVMLDYASYASARPPEHSWKQVRFFGNVFMGTCAFVVLATLAAGFFVPSSCVHIHERHNLTCGKIGAMKTPIELYRQHMGAYPATLTDLITPPAPCISAARWAGPYITNLDDLKDAWDHPFRYKVPGSGNPKAYDLWSVGPDGVDGTEDDIGNWK